MTATPSEAEVSWAEGSILDTDIAWELWGSRDPYYGVLTHPQFRSDALTPAAKELFFASGRHHVEHVLDVVRRRLVPGFTPERVLDFGCGVGRVVLPFAECAKEVVGADISPSMLAEARANSDAHALRNVALVRSDDTLSGIEGSFDLVHSCIVLQHIEIPRGRELFSRLVGKVRPGGCGALHVTFGWDIHEATFGQPPALSPAPPPAPTGPLSALKRTLRSLLRPPVPPAPPSEAAAVNPDPEMQMNYYNLSELMFILHNAGVVCLHTELTNHGGPIGAFLFFQIPA
jgi:SAM-dependent methyltransferase